MAQRNPDMEQARKDSGAQNATMWLLPRIERIAASGGRVQESTMAALLATLATVPTRPDRARGYRAPKPRKGKGPEPKSGAPAAVVPAKATAPSVAPEAGQ